MEGAVGGEQQGEMEWAGDLAGNGGNGGDRGDGGDGGNRGDGGVGGNGGNGGNGGDGSDGGIKHRGWVSIEKDSRSARRVDRSRQRQARLHTVGFGLAEGWRPDGHPTCGEAEGQPTLRYPSHKS